MAWTRHSVKSRAWVELTPYPTDERGFPVPTEELNLPLMENGVENMHHMNYYARVFGRFAISQTFRDLQSFQTKLPVLTHEYLHQRYGGIALPPLNNMLERIEQAHSEGEQMSIRLKGGYVLHRLTDIHLKTLHAEYNQINRSIA